MSVTRCPYESAVFESARSAQWNESLRAHLCECVECAEMVRVTEWMGGVATQLGHRQAAPDPSYVWLKAELQRRAQNAVSLSRRRLSSVALLGLALGLACAAAVYAIWPAASAAVSAARTWLLIDLAEYSLVDMTVIATAWLGLPLLLVATYLLVLRPLR